MNKKKISNAQFIRNHPHVNPGALVAMGMEKNRMFSLQTVYSIRSAERLKSIRGGDGGVSSRIVDYSTPFIPQNVKSVDADRSAFVRLVGLIGIREAERQLERVKEALAA